MSSTKRGLEYGEEQQALREVLEILLETEQISHDASMGIAKKIIADGNTKGLSQKQLKVFNDYIQPLIIGVKCESDCCNNVINMLYLKDAYDNQYEFGGLYCPDCSLDISKLKKILST